MKKMKENFRNNRCGKVMAFKGQVQPICGCSSCWDYYFYKNPGRVLAGALAIKRLGDDVVIKAQGTEYYQQMLPAIKMQILMGKRLDIDREAIVTNRGEKYLKNLKRYIKLNPLPENAIETADEAVMQAAAVGGV